MCSCFFAVTMVLEAYGLRMEATEMDVIANPARLHKSLQHAPEDYIILDGKIFFRKYGRIFQSPFNALIINKILLFCHL